jgi:hypothetical protein
MTRAIKYVALDVPQTTTLAGIGLALGTWRVMVGPPRV